MLEGESPSGQEHNEVRADSRSRHHGSKRRAKMRKARFGTSILVFVAMAFIITSSFSAAGEQSEVLPAKRHSTTVEFFGVDAADQIAKVLAGNGVSDITPAARPFIGSGGSIFWEKICLGQHNLDRTAWSFCLYIVQVTKVIMRVDLIGIHCRHKKTE